MKLKVGLIGAGGFGYLHLSGSEKSAKKAAQKFEISNVYWGDDWLKMLKENDLDVVSICAPNYLHAPMAIEAMKNNCNILCEKPIAISRDELKEMEANLRNKNLIFFSSFQKRYNPIIPQIKKIIESKALGEINLVRHFFCHYGPYTSWRPLSEQKWFFDSEKAGGGVLLDLGVHSIDLLRYLIGDFSKVEGYSYNTTCKNIANEDNCNVLVRFKNNALGIITVSWCNEPTDVVEIFGTQGILRIDLQASEPLSYKPKKLKRNEIIQEILEGKLESSVMPQHLLINHFIECILKGKQENPSFEDGKRASEFALEAYSMK
jgi:UDP-N-acetylglucosamine 3-dehydrogenase